MSAVPGRLERTGGGRGRSQKTGTIPGARSLIQHLFETFRCQKSRESIYSGILVAAYQKLRRAEMMTNLHPLARLGMQKTIYSYGVFGTLEYCASTNI